MGKMAAEKVAEKIRELLSIKDKITIVFAAAPSQDIFLEALVKAKGIEWKRVTALHLDEYIGLDQNSPNRFSTYLDEHLFNIVNPGKIYYLVDNKTDKEAIIKRYEKILNANPLDIACIGIGENGHIAFN